MQLVSGKHVASIMHGWGGFYMQGAHWDVITSGLCIILRQWASTDGVPPLLNGWGKKVWSSWYLLFEPVLIARKDNYLIYPWHPRPLKSGELQRKTRPSCHARFRVWDIISCINFSQSWHLSPLASTNMQKQCTFIQGNLRTHIL